jgi:hypothetical protein
LVVEASGICAELPLRLKRLADFPSRPGAKTLPAHRSIGGRRLAFDPVVNDEWALKGPASRLTIERGKEPTIAIAVALEMPEDANAGRGGQIRIIQYNDNGIMAGAVDYSIGVRKL